MINLRLEYAHLRKYDSLSDEIAVLMLTDVDYRTGEHDISVISKIARQWDRYDLGSSALCWRFKSKSKGVEYRLCRWLYI